MGDGLKMVLGLVVGALLVLLLVEGFSGDGMGYGMMGGSMMGGGAPGVLFALTFRLLVVALLAAVAVASTFRVSSRSRSPRATISSTSGFLFGPGACTTTGWSSDRVR